MIGTIVFTFLTVIFTTSYLSTLVATAPLTEKKCQIFKNLLGHRGANKTHWKLYENWGKLNNMLHWLQSICTRFTQKHRHGWVNLSVKKALWNIALTIKASLTVENINQHIDHQMKHGVKSQIFPKKSQYSTLDCFFDIAVRNDILTLSKTRITTTIQHEKRIDM